MLFISNAFWILARDNTFPQATKKGQLKHETAFIELGDLDPDKVMLETSHDEDGDMFEVDFERSDAALKIMQAIESGDASKTKAYLSSEYLFFDSEAGARRFGAALTHAVKLCGGKPAPF